MDKSLPFHKVKFQWLQLLSLDAGLSPRAVQLALYIVANHMLSEKTKAWTSDDKVSENLGICTKTVQRAKSELNEKWFNITPGTNRGKATIYEISDQSIVDANILHQEMVKKKQDNIVYLSEQKDGQNCRERRTEMSVETRQECPPKEELKIIKERSAKPIFVPKFGSSSSNYRTTWNFALKQNGLPELQLKDEFDGEVGYWLPRDISSMKFSDQSVIVQEWVAELQFERETAN